MCGRTACTLAPDDLCKSCGYMNKQGKWTEPKWRDPPGGQKYFKSYNVAPTSHTPILLSKSHFSGSVQSHEETELETEGDPVESGDASDWVIQPMHWGLVPSWHHGDPKSVGYSMINARSDGLLTKKTYKGVLEKGQRCVVLADGYFEWKAEDKGKKQPYFIYFPHASASSVEEVNKAAEVDNSDGSPKWTGKRILTMAGLFEKWTPKDGGEPLYSYSIVTTESHKEMAWLHERMPAILDGEDEVRAWLDSGKVPTNEALKLIRPYSGLQQHPVSSVVGDVKNKSEDCVKPVDLKKETQKEAASKNFMRSWLSQGSSGSKRSADSPDKKGGAEKSDKEEEEEKDGDGEEVESPAKKPKTE